MKRKKILVVGQTPPPYGGQAVMIAKLLQGDYPGVDLYHVRMSFSKEMDQMGRFQVSKLFHLVGVILKIYRYRFRHGIRVLYYPPSGPVFNALARDMAVLLATRWLFKRTVFQFFAGGMSEIYSGLSPAIRFLFRSSFFAPDVSVRPSEYSPDDGAFLHAKRAHIISWATEGNYARFADESRAGRAGNEPTILFAGVLKESKGIFVLLEACALLAAKGLEFKVNVLGKAESPAIAKRLDRFVAENGLGGRVRLLGVRTGDEYYREFARASIFCFPTYFESENLPIVTIDASEFALPIVATSWRGVRSVVEDGVTGFLVPVKDAPAVAGKLESLLADATLRETMGGEARKVYLDRFSIEAFYEKMGEVFREA